MQLTATPLTKLTKVYKAHTNYKCKLCGSQIKKKETYTRVVANFYGKLIGFTAHTECFNNAKNE